MIHYLSNLVFDLLLNFSLVLPLLVSLLFDESAFPFQTRVPRPKPNIGTWETFYPLNPVTKQHQPVSVFLEKQGIWDKSYHHKDMGVQIAFFIGSKCRTLAWPDKVE